MKICRITSTFVPPWEGLGPGPYELSVAQAKSGHKLTVITKYSRGCEAFDQQAPFKVYRIKAKRNLVFSFLAAVKFFPLHLREKYDVVHSHGDSAVAVVLFLIKKLFFLKVPVVTSVHIIRKTQYKRIQKADIYKVPREILGKEITEILPVVKVDRREIFFEKIYLNLSDSLAVVSKRLQEDIKNEYGISDKVFVILNGVNLSRFHKGDGDIEEYLKIRNNMGCKYLILFVGVLNGRKGEFALIKAMEKVLRKFPNTKLLIIGNGPTKSVAEKMAEALGIKDNVKFLPNVAYEKMQKYYTACDVFLSPSVSEGMPKVVLEAMACGAPVIASDISGHDDIVNDNETGHLFKTDDINDLASTIVKVLNDDNKRKKVSFNARKLIEEQYSWETVGKKLDYVYEIVSGK